MGRITLKCSIWLNEAEMKKRIKNVIYSIFQAHSIEGLLTFVKDPSLARIIFRLKHRAYELLHPGYPWLTPKGNALLIRWLSPHMKGFEWGSGRSTLFFSIRVRHLVSIEHDAYWFKRVNSALKQKGIRNVDYRFVPPLKNVEPTGINWSVVWPGYKYLQMPPSRTQFVNYFNAINNFPDNHFDFILVDGRARVPCMLNAILKLFESWKRISTKDQVHGKTNIWIKPKQ